MKEGSEVKIEGRDKKSTCWIRDSVDSCLTLGVGGVDLAEHSPLHLASK